VQTWTCLQTPDSSKTLSHTVRFFNPFNQKVKVNNKKWVALSQAQLFMLAHTSDASQQGGKQRLSARPKLQHISKKHG